MTAPIGSYRDPDHQTFSGSIDASEMTTKIIVITTNNNTNNIYSESYGSETD